MLVGLVILHPLDANSVVPEGVPSYEREECRHNARRVLARPKALCLHDSKLGIRLSTAVVLLPASIGGETPHTFLPLRRFRWGAFSRTRSV